MRAGISTAIVVAFALAAGASQGAAAGRLPLTQAADAGDVVAVRALLSERPADVNATEPDGATALHYAANRGNLEIVEALLAAGADAAAANRYGVTPVSLASRSGNALVVERLLEAGADPNVTIGAGRPCS